MQEFTLGLDIGIASIGWAIINQQKGKLIDFGVHIFEEASPAQEARLNRSARRTKTRRNWRKKQMKQAFVDFGLLTKEEIDQPDYLSFTTNSELIKKTEDETVQHLRLRALQEHVNHRELLLALYNICNTRGHFLMETVDFSKDTISFEMFKEKFIDIVSEYLEINSNTDFEEKILKPLFINGKISSRDIKNIVNNSNFTRDDNEDDKLIEIIKLLSGFKSTISKIDEDLMPDMSGTVDILGLLKKDDLPSFLNSIIELHDMVMVSQILKESKYICEFNVKKLEEVKEIQKLEKTNPEEYQSRKKVIQSKMSGSLNNRLRVIRNMENKFPNGLYVKEVRDILKTQQKYEPSLITDEFIEVCSSIVSARIPYYVGPLSEFAKNSWLIKPKNENFKYSYEYSRELINEFETIKAWKSAMISHCTYFPEETALPKGSFLAETFSLLNEMNILQATDLDGNTYYLTQEDKIKAFDDLFLIKNNVSYQELVELLGLSYFGARKSKQITKFKNCYSLYHTIVQNIPELRITSILEIFSKPNKINAIEEIILNINLFDEEKSKKEYFIQNMKLDDKVAQNIAKLKSNGFYSFSKQLILNTVINQNGQTMLEKLLDDNSDDCVNEQMSIISNATDEKGNPLNLESNKYLKKLKDNHHLSIDLLIDNGKPFIPISRSVIRALNECFKLYEEVIRTYGVPSRVIIETARDLKDSNVVKTVPAKHFDEMKKCYKYLEDQIKEQKKKNKYLKFELEEWETLESYLAENKPKIELYIRQNGKDMISGDSIDINKLYEYEIDHVLPRGFGDNSMDNLMLIHRDYNGKKADRLPLEYLEQEDVRTKDGKHITSSDFMRRVFELFDLKMISEKKVKQLTLKSTDEAMSFINRNLVDTRYIIKELTSILKAYNEVNDYNTHIVSLKASFTSIYRNAFGINKNRDVGDQHHAYDAATVAIADKVLSTYYPNYDLRGNQKAYKDFLAMIHDEMDLEKTDKDKLNRFIRIAYKKAYGNYPNDNDSLISEIKNTVPLYSLKPEKGFTGEFFNATLYAPKNGKSPLDVLEINNDKRSFSGVNCVAVDFYKYTDSKNKKKHVAIHIPKVIVNSRGEINKEQYLKLVRDYYKEPFLIDENGEIKDYYFRLRIFKNELVYDTANYTIQKFNIGSMANTKLEMKHLYNFSYNDIDKKVLFFKKNISEKFDLKMSKVNPNGKNKFVDIDIKEIIDFSIDNLMDIENVARYRKAICDILGKEKSFIQFLEKMAYLDLIVNRNCTSPTIVGRYIPTANTIGEEAQYIKLKSSILGVRYTYNDNGKIMISGPRHNPQMFSKIKKEKFTWTITNLMLE